jgi:hypothetical protein
MMALSDCHMTDPDEQRREAIRLELSRLEESAMWGNQSQFEQAKIWRGATLGLGMPASGLAAVAGAAGLAGVVGRVEAGLLSLGAAAFGAILTVVNATQRMNQASAAGNAYLEIQTAARQTREIDLPYLEVGDARTMLAELTAGRDEVHKTTEPPSRRAYRRAARNIRKDGGQAYSVDAGVAYEGSGWRRLFSKGSKSFSGE